MNLIFRFFVRLCYFSSRHPECGNQFRNQDGWQATAAGRRGQWRWRRPGGAARKPQEAVRRGRRGYSLIDRWLCALCEWLDSMSVYQKTKRCSNSEMILFSKKKRKEKHFLRKSNLTGLSCKKLACNIVVILRSVFRTCYTFNLHVTKHVINMYCSCMCICKFMLTFSHFFLCFC